MSVPILRVRHIGRPVVVLALPRIREPDWLEDLVEWFGMLRHAFRVQQVSAIPPYLRDDLGLPPDPARWDDARQRPQPLDPLVAHGWRRW